MMGEVSLGMPSAAALAIAEEIRRFGRQSLETGGFLLAPEGTDRVTFVALAGDTGIERSWGLFEISAIALDRLFGFASSEDPGSRRSSIRTVLATNSQGWTGSEGFV